MPDRFPCRIPGKRCTRNAIPNLCRTTTSALRVHSLPGNTYFVPIVVRTRRHFFFFWEIMYPSKLHAWHNPNQSYGDSARHLSFYVSHWRVQVWKVIPNKHPVKSYEQAPEASKSRERAHFPCQNRRNPEHVNIWRRCAPSPTHMGPTITLKLFGKIIHWTRFTGLTEELAQHQI